MTVHTSGPWRAVMRGDNWEIVAGEFPYQRTVMPTARETDEDMLNARLIAAAPEMLEALRGLFEHCAIIHSQWGDGSNQREADEVVRLARAVLAKVSQEKLCETCRRPMERDGTWYHCDCGASSAACDPTGREYGPEER